MERAEIIAAIHPDITRTQKIFWVCCKLHSTNLKDATGISGEIPDSS